MQRSWYRSCVDPTWTTRAGSSASSSRHASKVDFPGGVVRTHGSSPVPFPVTSVPTVPLTPCRPVGRHRGILTGHT